MLLFDCDLHSRLDRSAASYARVYALANGANARKAAQWPLAEGSTMPASGTKRTSEADGSMSAIGGKADIGISELHVCF
jgi:hypothetical protein